MSDTGYKPSASELQYQRFWAKELLKKGLFDGSATTQVDWDRLARDADRNGDREAAAMTLTEIVEQLRMCGYTCEAGALENNVAFQALEQLAATTVRGVPVSPLVTVPKEIDRILRAWGLMMMAFAARVRGDEGEAISEQISAVARWLDAQPGQEPTP